MKPFRKYELYCKPSKVGEGRYEEACEKSKFSTPEDVYEAAKMLGLHVSPREKTVAFYIDTRGHLLGAVEVSSGGIDSATVDPKVIFAPALAISKTAAIIFCHNHPSGDLTPSQEDKDLTNRIKKAGEILGIKLIDHVIVGENGYMSFKERSICF